MKYIPGTPGAFYREKEVRIEEDISGNIFSSSARAFQSFYVASEHRGLSMFFAYLYLAIIAGIVIGSLLCSSNGMKVEGLLLVFALLFVVCLGLVIAPDKRLDRKSTIKNQIIAAVGCIAAIVVFCLLYILKKDVIRFNVARVMMIGIIVSSILGVVIVICGLVKASQMNKSCKTVGIAKVKGYEDIYFSDASYSRVITRPVYSLNHDGKEYEVLLGDSYIETIDIPNKGSMKQVFYNASNPYELMLTKTGSRINQLVVCGIAFLALAATFGIGKVLIDSPDLFIMENQGDVLTDKSIKRNVIHSNNGDFVVYDREVLATDGNRYYFDEIGGISSDMVSTEEFEVGEEIFWIQVGDKFYVMHKDGLTYKGSRYYRDLPDYTTDGRYKLTDEYITNRVGTSSFEVYEVSFKRIDGGRWLFTSDNGRTFEMLSKPDNCIFYWNLSAGERFYWISTSNGVTIMSEEKNVYTGSKLV